jgi:hypothetical protein
LAVAVDVTVPLAAAITGAAISAAASRVVAICVRRVRTIAGTAAVRATVGLPDPTFRLTFRPSPFAFPFPIRHVVPPDRC